MKNKQLCILAVDDCIDVLDLIKISLETTTKWRVRLSSSGQEGLRDVQKELPDLILTDFQMPGMTGIEMIEKLRGQPKTLDIPILLLTSFPPQISSKILQKLDIGNAISKPFDWFTLADLIVSGLESRSQGLALYHKN